jgi:hypothetical protein
MGDYGMLNGMKTPDHRVIKPPCGKDCPRRRVGCHSSCEDYAKFQEVLKAEKEKARKAAEPDFIATDYMIESAKQHKKGWSKYV